jgi:hypothetical protein
MVHLCRFTLQVLPSITFLCPFALHHFFRHFVCFSCSDGENERKAPNLLIKDTFHASVQIKAHISLFYYYF